MELNFNSNCAQSDKTNIAKDVVFATSNGGIEFT